MSAPKHITEATTLAELREQLLLAGIIALRNYTPFDSEEPRAASLHHATGFYVGYGPTEAVAIEAAFVKLRRALMPASLCAELEQP